MRRLLVTILALCVTGCGAEVLGTAAVSGASRAQEAKQAQQNIERIQKKLDAAVHTGQERAAEADKAGGY